VANFAAQFEKFHEDLWHYYPQLPYIPWPVGVVVLTDNTSKYKEFIVTVCNTRTHYVRPLMIKMCVIILIITIKVTLQELDLLF